VKGVTFVAQSTNNSSESVFIDTSLTSTVGSEQT